MIKRLDGSLMGLTAPSPKAPIKPKGKIVPFPRADRLTLMGRAPTPPASPLDQRGAFLAILKENVRNGTYQPDIRQLALDLILDDRQPLAGPVAETSRA